jgi:hypothetical protein
MRFELTADMISALKGGATVSMGVEHENYYAIVDPVADNIRDSLAGDLN